MQGGVTYMSGGLGAGGASTQPHRQEDRDNQDSGPGQWGAREFKKTGIQETFSGERWGWAQGEKDSGCGISNVVSLSRQGRRPGDRLKGFGDGTSGVLGR